MIALSAISLCRDPKQDGGNQERAHHFSHIRPSVRHAVVAPLVDRRRCVESSVQQYTGSERTIAQAENRTLDDADEKQLNSENR
jgi:hypothetical protein